MSMWRATSTRVISTIYATPAAGKPYLTVTLVDLENPSSFVDQAPALRHGDLPKCPGARS